MFRKCVGSDPLAAQLDFALWAVTGNWISREGAPRVRIYRNRTRKGGAYYLELAYDTKTVFQLPIKRYWGNIWYFDLYGLVGLAFDAGRDVLQLSAFGDYYRAEE